MFDDTELALYTKKQRAGISFLINPLTPSVSEGLREQNTSSKTETSFVAGRRQTEKKQDVDYKALQEDTLDHVIGDWEGILDENDKLIPCTRENKVSIADYYPSLGVAWVRLASVITAKAEADRLQKDAEAEKNSGNMSAGKSAEQTT